MIDINNIRGKAMKFGDKINTDVIIPSHYLEDRDPMIYCKHVMKPIRPSTYEEAQERPRIIVAGVDFGSGSSREQAPEAIKAAGIVMVIAESFASIFFRNSFNVGLPILEAPGILDLVEEGNDLQVDIEKASIQNLTSNTEIKGKSLEPFLLNKTKKGGLIPELKDYVREHNL